MFEDSFRMIVISDKVLICENVALRNQWAIKALKYIYALVICI